MLNTFSEKENESPHEKTCLQGFRSGQDFQAIAASQRLEILDSESRKISLSTQRKAKVLISLRSNAADQHLCFRIYKKKLFLMTTLIWFLSFSNKEI